MSKKENLEIENNQEREDVSVEKESTREDPRYFKSIEDTLGKHLEEDKMKPEIKKEAAFYITKEQDEATLGFMRQFVKDNKDNLKDKGLWTENGDDKYILNIAKELDWKDALVNDEKYEKYKESLEHFDYLNRNFSKDNVPQQAKFLMVNKLNSAIEKREEELLSKGKNINTDNELKKLYTLSESISSDITGQDFRKNIQKENVMLDRETSIANGLERFREEAKNSFDSESKPLVLDTEGMLKDLGYDIQLSRDKLFRREVVVYSKDDEGNPKKIKTFKAGFFSEKPKDKKQFERFLDSKLDEELKKKLGEMYDMEVFKNNVIVNEKIREKIKEIASAPEKAEGGIEAFFEEANEKDIEEEKRKIDKKREANAKKKVVVPKKELGQKETWNDLTRNAVKIADSLNDLPENFDEAYESLSGVLGDAGYETVGLDYFEKDEWFQKNVAGRYGEAFKNRGKNKKEYNGWLVQFLRAIITNFTKK
jgi:hypothetical protein